MTPHSFMITTIALRLLSHETTLVSGWMLPARRTRHHTHSDGSFSQPQRAIASTAPLYAKKAKLSMADKRKRRAKRLPPRSVTEKPADFSGASTEQTDSSEHIKSPIVGEQLPSEVAHVEKAPQQQRAKQLIEAQRTSVDMLTCVRERVEALPKQQMQQSLENMGYYVHDGFLGDDHVIDQLQMECTLILDKDQMDVDLENLGHGEYILSLKGGEEQYAQCPRLVELVVSATKHMPAMLRDYTALDSSACMAVLRSFGRKSRLASLELLQGSALSDGDASPALDRPFGIVATEREDSRRITMLYYPIASEWDQSGVEGGLTFEESGVTIPAKRDRLVLLASDSCRFRRNTWIGRNDLNAASCVELHFVKTS